MKQNPAVWRGFDFIATRFYRQIWIIILHYRPGGPANTTIIEPGQS